VIKAPILETDRLVLRPYQRDDFGAVAAMWAEPEVFGHVGAAEPMPPDEVWAKLLRSAGLWSLVGHGFWAIEGKAEGRLIGEVGFGDRRRADPRFADLPETGCAFASFAQGKGYATEAVRAALAWADTALPGRATLAVIAPANTASIRVAEKCGYAEFMRAPSRGRDRIMFKRPFGAAA
jgi:RimJ/RimL family protein N-acetyltransferase